MDTPTTFPDWPAKRDAIRAQLASRQPRLYHAGPLSLASGAVVQLGSLEPRVVARTAFLTIAAAVEPRLLVELAGDPLDQFAALWDVFGGPPTVDPGSDVDPAVHLRCQAVLMSDGGSALWRWCLRWGLPAWDDSLASAPELDLRTVIRLTADRAWALYEAHFALLCWRMYPLGPGAERHFGRGFLYSQFANDAELGLDRALSLPSQRWDPHGEERAAAARRITADLGRAVRAELRRIEAEALRTTVAPPAKRTVREHLAWLARYQFRHETYSAIAKDVRLTRQTVTDAVKQAADLVGLPLRQPSDHGDRRRAVEGSNPSG